MVIPQASWQPAHQETTAAVKLTVELSAVGGVPHAAISRLGEGWIAEEGLAIVGNLLGLAGGEQCLPQ